MDVFIQKFAKETVEWVKSVRTLMSVLRVWAEGFGRVISPCPDITSEAFDAFLFVVDVQLPALCIDLEVAVAGHLLPQLRILHDTIRRPALLLDTLHAFEPHHHALLHHNSDSRPSSALDTASIVYVTLRPRLCDELPVYLSPSQGFDVIRGEVASPPMAGHLDALE